MGASKLDGVSTFLSDGALSATCGSGNVPFPITNDFFRSGSGTRESRYNGDMGE